MICGHACGRMTMISMVVFVGCMITASVMDLHKQRVIRLVWLIAGMASAGNAGAYVAENGIERRVIVELLLFVLLQQIWFCRFYGRADCHAFSVCALFMSGFGWNMYWWILHMAVTFLLLALVQLAKKNVNKKGNLKKPVPLIPYITISLFLLYPGRVYM